MAAQNHQFLEEEVFIHHIRQFLNVGLQRPHIPLSFLGILEHVPGIFPNVVYGERILSLTIALVFILAMACANTGPLEEMREDTFNVGSWPRLIVHNDNGRIDVTSGPSGIVVIQSFLRMPSKQKNGTENLPNRAFLTPNLYSAVSMKLVTL